MNSNSYRGPVGSSKQQDNIFITFVSHLINIPTPIMNIPIPHKHTYTPHEHTYIPHEHT